MLAAKWIVHLYAGAGKGADPILKELDDGRVLLEVDIARSKAFDMNKFGGVYRGLLWAAATGRIAGVIGAPPCRNSSDTSLVMKQLWLTLVAKAAAIRQGEFPVFAVVEGRKLFETIKGDFGQGWEALGGLVFGTGGDVFGRSSWGHGYQFGLHFSFGVYYFRWYDMELLLQDGDCGCGTAMEKGA